MEPSECSCICDGDPIEPYEHKTPRARWPRVCDECGGTITKGERYHVHSGRCDGSWIHVRNCSQCERIRHDYGCGCIGDLDVEVYECLGVHINEVPDDEDEC